MANRLPRGPTGIPVFGSSLDFAADTLGFMEACARKYGGFVRIDTLDQRKRIQPAFSREQLDRYAETMVTLHPDPPVEFEIRAH